MYILGIESSCDESAASIIKTVPGGFSVLSNVVSSQIEIHKKYGGVVPEVAAREHVLNILPVVNEALEKAKIKPDKIAAIGVTKGPGLITSLIAGVETARSLAFAWNKPVIEVNHIEGHLYANFIESNKDIKLPALVLTVSGGHTTLVLITKIGKLRILGETRDDAAGEAFDKAAKMLNLGYPGGPIISNMAERYLKTSKKGAESSHPRITLPRPMIESGNSDFSFSGLKTALLYQLQKDNQWKNRVPEYCYEFQQAIIDILVSKTIKTAEKFKVRTVMLSGGVSANKELRSQLESAVKNRLPFLKFLVPSLQYTTDNAAMIAMAAALKYKPKNLLTYRKLRVDSSLQLR